MKRVCLVLLALLSSRALLSAQFISFVLEYHPSEGNAFTTVPFGDYPQGTETFRYQQVYPAEGFYTELGGIPPGGALLTVMAFRVDSLGGRPFTDTFPVIQINFSTTARSENDLSLVFAENVGPNDTMAVGPGPLTIQSGHSPMSSPQAWDPRTRIEMTTPFAYDPREGNLLMDIRIFEGPDRQFPLDEPVVYDAFDVANDGVGRVWSDSVTQSVADFSDTTGLATIMVFRPIPEPSATAVLGLGLVGLGLLARPRRNVP